MTTPNGLQPPGNILTYGTWAEVQAKTQEDWADEQNAQWNSAFSQVASANLPDWFGALKDALGGTYSGGDALFHSISTIARAFSGVFDFGKIIPLSSIAQTTPNLLTNAGFDDAVSLDGGDAWTWDDTVGRSSPGSARAEGNGLAKALQSNAIETVEGQTIAVSTFLTWSEIACVGNAFELYVASYADNMLTGTTLINTFSSPITDSVGWQQLSGTYTVPPGVDSVRLRIRVTTNVTAGTVWFDDAEMTKPATTVPQGWVTGLPTELADLWDSVGTLIDSLLDSIGLLAEGTVFDRIFDLADGVGDWLLDTENTAGDVNTLQGNLISTQQNVSDSQSRTQVLEGVIGYGSARMAGHFTPGSSFARVPFTVPVGPIVGMTHNSSAGYFTLGSKGLWEFSMKVCWDYLVAASKGVQLDLVVIAPDNSVYYRSRNLLETTDTEVTMNETGRFVVPAAGYRVEVQASAMTDYRGLRGEVGYNQFNLVKISSETS